jgi:hypothetical protein
MRGPDRRFHPSSLLTALTAPMPLWSGGLRMGERSKSVEVNL